MEITLNTILNQMRLDAIEKFKNTDKHQNEIVDAAKNIMILANLARKEGLLALESIAQTISSNFLKQLIILVVDGTYPEIIIEIATNIYWTKTPSGTNAMINYIYLRGMLGIQNGINPRSLEEILLSLMPSEQQKNYHIQMKLLHQNNDVDKIFQIHPNFQDAEIWESIHSLETIINKLSNRCIQRLIRDLQNQDLAICIYVFEQDIRKKILDNLSKGLSHAIIEDVALCTSISAQDVSASILKVQDTINSLWKAGEIYQPDNINSYNEN